MIHNSSPQVPWMHLFPLWALVLSCSGHLVLPPPVFVFLCVLWEQQPLGEAVDTPCCRPETASFSLKIHQWFLSSVISEGQHGGRSWHRTLKALEWSDKGWHWTSTWELLTRGSKSPSALKSTGKETENNECFLWKGIWFLSSRFFFLIFYYW